MSHAVDQTSAADINSAACRQLFVELFPVLYPLRDSFLDGEQVR